MILYFSGTGNSEHIARSLARELAESESIYSINEGIKNHTYPDLADDNVLIFSVPTYAWRFPRVVSEWIEDTDVFSNKMGFFILSCGDGIGNAAGYIKAFCSRKNIYYMGCVKVLMPENYIALFDCPSEEESVRIVREADKQVRRITPFIDERVPLPDEKVTIGGGILSSMVNPLFYRFYINSKRFEASDACIGCGICEELCPLNNITLIDGRPRWDGSCTHCMACICGCPAEAIEYDSISPGKRRYHCPDTDDEEA